MLSDKRAFLGFLNRTQVKAEPAVNSAETDEKKASLYRRHGKRLIDVSVSSVALVALSPFLIIVGILVKCTSPGPAFYWQDRVGRDGKIFRIAKFRSMVAGADKRGPDVTSAGDARVTGFGRILRKFKIDEFPQLWNVLKGEMSLVGPRPELPRYVANYTPNQRRVLSVRPGITDVASLQYRHEEAILAKSGNPEEFYRSVVLPHKLDLNLEYIQGISLSFDMNLIFQTVKALFV